MYIITISHHYFILLLFTFLPSGEGPKAICVSGITEDIELDSFFKTHIEMDGYDRLSEKDRRQPVQVQRYVSKTLKEMERIFHEGKLNYYYHDL